MVESDASWSGENSTTSAAPRGGALRTSPTGSGRSIGGPGRSGGQRFSNATHLVGIGSLEPADAERARRRGKVRATLAVRHEQDPFAGERVEAQLVPVGALVRFGVSSDFAVHGVILPR